jgi:hypothetical protein
MAATVQIAPGAGQQAFTLSGTVTLQPAGLAAAPRQLGGEAMGISDLFRRDDKGDEERTKLSQAIQEFIRNATEAVKNAAKEATTLQVVTYTLEELDDDEIKAILDAKDALETEIEKAAQPRAITRIGALGDVKVYVPHKDGEIDEALWTVHSDMVQQAQANRTALIKAMAEVIGGLGA